MRENWKWSLPVPAGTNDGALDWPQDFRRLPLPLNGTWIWHWGEPQWMPGWMLRIYPYDRHLDVPEILAIYIMPLTAIIGGAVVMLGVLWKIGWATTVRDHLIAIFTGFMLSYLALTLIGAAFRGQGQELVPPTHVPNLEEYPNIMRQHDPPSQFVLVDMRASDARA